MTITLGWRQLAILTGFVTLIAVLAAAGTVLRGIVLWRAVATPTPAPGNAPSYPSYS